MKYLALALVLLMATSAFGLEKQAFQMRDDFGTEPLYDSALQYYYYIPCPTYSWFWAFSGWSPGDISGEYFHIGDQGTGGWPVLDPMTCMQLQTIRILDFAGYGTTYPGLFTAQLDVWCPPCPLYNLWSSGPIEFHFGWNYTEITPPLLLCPCWDAIDLELTIVVTMSMIGTNAIYPALGLDNISTAVATGCVMHDLGCLPAVYPRASVHSGYFGNGDPCQYDPPPWFCDGRDTTPTCTQFGGLELAWTVYIICCGMTDAETSTWGNIKSMYR